MRGATALSRWVRCRRRVARAGSGADNAPLALRQPTADLADSLTTVVGHTGYDIDDLTADLHRFVFPLGLNDAEQPFGEPTP